MNRKKINTDKIIQAFEENPVAFMAGAGTLLIGVSKIIDSVASARGSNAYARQVDYRIKNKK